MISPSKELLMAALDIKQICQTLYLKEHCFGNELCYGFSSSKEFQQTEIANLKFINIYEFAQKCKEWAWDNNYVISCVFDGRDSGIVTIFNMGMERIHYLSSSSEINAIIEACEWILKDLNK